MQSQNMSGGRKSDVLLPYLKFSKATVHLFAWSPGVIHFPATLTFPPKQQRLWGLGPRLWSSHNSLKSQRGSTDYLQRVSLCSYSPGGLSQVIYESDWIEEQNSFPERRENRYSTSHFAALPRTVEMKKKMYHCVKHSTCSFFANVQGCIQLVICDNDK